MNKLLIILVALLWCNVGFAGCIKGDCTNGYGTYTWPSGTKYVGEWKDDIPHGQGTFTYADGTFEKGIYDMGELIKPN